MVGDSVMSRGSCRRHGVRRQPVQSRRSTRVISPKLQVRPRIFRAELWAVISSDSSSADSACGVVALPAVSAGLKVGVVGAATSPAEPLLDQRGLAVGVELGRHSTHAHDTPSKSSEPQRGHRPAALRLAKRSRCCRRCFVHRAWPLAGRPHQIQRPASRAFARRS